MDILSAISIAKTLIVQSNYLVYLYLQANMPFHFSVKGESWLKGYKTFFHAQLTQA